MALSIKTTKLKGITTLTVAGRLINVDSEKFQKKLAAYITKNPGVAVIDITDVNFIDSFGLGSLVQFHSEISKAGGKLIILNRDPDPDTYVQRLFSMTQLNRVFTIAGNETDLMGLLN